MSRLSGEVEVEVVDMDGSMPGGAENVVLEARWLLVMEKFRGMRYTVYVHMMSNAAFVYTNKRSSCLHTSSSHNHCHTVTASQSLIVSLKISNTANSKTCQGGGGLKH